MLLNLRTHIARILMPTVHLSNWSSYRTPGAHGPGRKWTIMARPRRWERGEGSVPLLAPDTDDLLLIQQGGLSRAAYRNAFLRLVAYRVKVKGSGIVPGGLLAETPLDPVPVADGDTLLCACGVLRARAGQCHRTWAAGLLALAGWDVVLDQRPISPEQGRALLGLE